MIDARADYQLSRTDDPVKQATIRVRQAQQKVKFAQTPAERLSALAEVNNAERDKRQAIFDQRVGNIDFDLEMERIDRQTAIDKYEALLQSTKLTKEQKRTLQQKIHALQKEAEQDAGGFDLDVGSIKMPTVLDVRRAFASIGQVHRDAVAERPRRPDRPVQHGQRPQPRRRQRPGQRLRHRPQRGRPGVRRHRPRDRDRAQGEAPQRRPEVAMARNTFTNPSNGDAYQWLVNHDEEEDAGKTRSITRTGLTSNVGTVKQQAEDGPLLLRFRGKIVDRSQYQAMWAWFELSRAQTIYFTDFDGQSYEVQITSFTPKRVRKSRAPQRDPSTPLHYWEYGIEMEVYKVLAGDLIGVAP